MVRIPRRAIDSLAIYIIGCQPGLVEQYLWPSGRPHDHTLVLDPQEPRNIGYYGWPQALWSVRRDNPDEPLWPMVACLLQLATDRAEQLAQDEGLSLPLTPPKKFNLFSDAEWQPVASRYLPRLV